MRRIGGRRHNDGDVSPHRSWHPWEVLIALIALVVMYSLVSPELRPIAVGVLPVLVVILLTVMFAAHFRKRRVVARSIAIALAGVGTFAVLSSVVMLVIRLIQGDLAAPYLLRDAALLWITNVIVYGLWYWELDGGGPHARHLHDYQATDLLFPQTMMGGEFAAGWTPAFIDYLFVAFNASTAFSPTDTSVLSGRAKGLMMMQSLASIVLLAVVAARAINILH